MRSRREKVIGELREVKLKSDNRKLTEDKNWSLHDGVEYQMKMLQVTKVGD